MTQIISGIFRQLHIITYKIISTIRQPFLILSWELRVQKSNKVEIQTHVKKRFTGQTDQKRYAGV